MCYKKTCFCFFLFQFPFAYFGQTLGVKIFSSENIFFLKIKSPYMISHICWSVDFVFVFWEKKILVGILFPFSFQNEKVLYFLIIYNLKNFKLKHVECCHKMLTKLIILTKILKKLIFPENFYLWASTLIILFKTCNFAV